MDRGGSLGVKIFCYLGFFLAAYGVIAELPKIRLTTMFFALVYIFLCYNLFKLRNWSRVSLLVINAIIAAIMTIGNFCVFIWMPWTCIQGGITESFIEAFRMVIPLLLRVYKSVRPYNAIFVLVVFLMAQIHFYGFLIYFTRPKVKQQFREDQLEWHQVARQDRTASTI